MTDEHNQDASDKDTENSGDLPDRPRKLRIDGTSERVRIAAAAKRVIVPPDNIPLNDEEMVFFNNIINERTRADWSAHQIEMASLLARAMHGLNRQSAALSKEGELIRSPEGKVIQNPRKKMIEDSWKIVVAIRRSMGVHSRAMHGDPREAMKREIVAKGYEQDALNNDDGLLAMPVDWSNIQ